MAEQKTFQKEFKQGDVLFCEYEPGNSFYLIKKGKVKITKITEKYEKILDILEEGSIFGEMAIIEQAPRSATAIAETDLFLTEFTKENFKDILNAFPDLLANLIRILCFRISEAKRRLSILQLRDNEAKVMDAILMLVENYIRRNPDKAEEKHIALNTTVADVGRWCGLDENTAKGIIFNLERNGKIETKPNTLIIKDLPDIVRIVERKRKYTKNE